MPIGILYWVLMTLWLIFGFAYREIWWTSPLLLFILLFLLGWKVFGFIVKE